MTKISYRKLTPDRSGQILNQLWQAVTLLESKEEVVKFLRNILTRTEMVMLSKRLEAIRMLDEGERYVDIRKQLNMSDVTIAKLNDQFLSFGEGYRLVIGRLKNLNKEKDKKKRIVTGQTRQAQELWKGTARGLGIIYKKYRKHKSAAS